ncbi:MAG: hypothetical protein Q9221_000933 [Calogaya cf. arnoldii]
MTDPGPIFDRLGLGQYLERFVDEGFETWETVLDITESDLDALGVKLGHRRRLQREISNATGNDDNRHNDAAGLETIPQPSISLDSTGSYDRQLPPILEGTKPGKRKYRRHPKADEYAPERPQSAYVIFSNIKSLPLLSPSAANEPSEVRDELKSENLSFTEIAKRVGEKWQTLSPEEREPFEARAASAKEGYLTELARYKKTDQFQEHAVYLADFKAKHSSEADGKKPRLEVQPGIGTNDSIESQDGSPEPALINGVPRRMEETSSSIYRLPAGRSAAEASPSYSHDRCSPRPRYSPTTSVSSQPMSGCTEKSSSPVTSPAPRQLPYASRERDSAKRPELLPPITSFEPRDLPVTRGSSSWFDNHLGSTLNTTSPLSNFRRSYHPPALFVHQGSTSSSSKSSNSRSESSDPSDATGMFANGPHEESNARHQPPISLKGLEAPIPSTQTGDLKSRVPILPHPQGSFRSLSHFPRRTHFFGSAQLTVLKPKAPSHRGPSLSGLSLKVGFAKPSQNSLVPPSPSTFSPQETHSSKSGKGEAFGLRGTLGLNADPVAVRWKGDHASSID